MAMASHETFYRETLTVKLNCDMGFQDSVFSPVNSPYHYYLATAIGLALAVIMLVCVLTFCAIAASMIVIFIYIVCECIYGLQFETSEDDIEVGIRENQAGTWHNIPGYETPDELPWDEDESREEEENNFVEQLFLPVRYGGIELEAKSRDCSICLDDYEDEDMCTVLPLCKHVFHANCIDYWFMKNTTCPTRFHIQSKQSERGGAQNKFHPFGTNLTVVLQAIRDSKEVLFRVFLDKNGELGEPPEAFKLVLDISKSFFVLQFKLLFLRQVSLFSGSAEDLETEKWRHGQLMIKK
ncbi:hypothetical protein K2173_007746 [Erythroxylum novogranatense]|uniref:RING-type domain-containing protein n=1 Tax=Erythroxylum novogranatense TaxID=1862640 RepID=A0AAV8TEP8_9ROSI|nr:hypothetical protein K2173_007746 [Erythroxylum novogranatense]